MAGDRCAPAFLGDFLDRPRLSETPASARHQDLDRAVFFLNPIPHRFDFNELGDVGYNRNRPTSSALNLCVHL
jgi:hypothetical protein